MSKKFLGEFEWLILMAIMKLGENAYGVTIAETIEEWTEKRVSIGALYTSLSRLEEKGLVRSRTGDPTEERGGRAKKFYMLDTSGITTLQQIEKIRNSALENLELLPVLV